MSNWILRRSALAAGISLAPIALLIAFISGGAGHGTYVGARIVLPYACLGLGQYFGAGWIVSILALLQWPINRVLVDRAPHKVLTAGIILATHVTLSVWLFKNAWPQFN
jgi:hypothetical protein